MLNLSLKATKPYLVILLLLAGLVALGAAPEAPQPELGGPVWFIEAESGEFFGLRQETSLNGYNGTGYVRFPSFDLTALGLTLDVPEAGWYLLRLRYATEADDGIFQVRIDGEQRYLGAQRLPAAANFKVQAFNYPVYLSAGEERLVISSLADQWLLDQLIVEIATPESLAELAPCPDLITANALPQATAVYHYLLANQGKAILSGQQIYAGLAEINVIYNLTGKYPALFGGDLIDYSPSRVRRGTRSFVAQDAIKYWKAGGLISLAWHWNAPTGLIDQEPDKQWYFGFYSRAVNFDLAAALVDPTSANYSLLLKDIDAIAKELKRLNDQAVPVLWRPLHEASGAWFWWGAWGPEAYIELYKLLYERLTNYHHLNNLIWVWNGQDPAWYPGDDYVDIMSVDLYPARRHYLDHLDRLAELQACSYESKLTAISENGTLPDIEAIAEQALPWAWFCTWDGQFVVDPTKKHYSEEYTEAESLKRYYEHPWLITRDELPAF